MITSKHTPGPWIVIPEDRAVSRWVIGTTEHSSVAECAPAGLMGKDEADANARLIVAAVNACFQAAPQNPLAFAEAAPKMLELLQTVANGDRGLSGALNYQGRMHIFADQARALLAKIDEKES
mgnify:CR=1 FL=1